MIRTMSHVRFLLSVVVLPVTVIMVVAYYGTRPDEIATLTRPVAAATAKPLAQTFEIEWNRLIAGAQREGELVWNHGSGADASVVGPVFDAFSRKFGIRVISSPFASRGNVDRMLAEQRAGRWSTCSLGGVILTSGWSEQMILKISCHTSSTQM
jgi:hypothetical protein